MESNCSILEIEGAGYKLESGKGFETSYYQKEYRQAYEVVQTIVNETLHKDEKKTEIQNIVPFIGKRGSGKTSAMKSFIQSLEEYSLEDARRMSERGSGEPFFVFQDEQRSDYSELDIEFTCMDSIDGSLLERGEDIFKLILAQMYTRFDEMEQKTSYRENCSEYDRRELKQQFEKVFRSVCRLTNPQNTDFYYEESPITSLRSLSSSMTTKEEFRLLVEQYLRMISSAEKKRCDRRSSVRFLVISIDDLDMNIENGFDMLEKIHRYLMVERVIVVLALDYDQIKTLCEKSFFDMVSDLENRRAVKNRSVHRLARDFLDKVLPASERIYIPDIGKVSDVKIRMLPENGDVNDAAEPKPLKEAILTEVCRKLRMRMDVGGGKRHFYEQNSLRAFVNFYLMLYRMERPGSAKSTTKGRRGTTESNRILCFDRNYKVLMWDTTNRMLDERLEAEYKELFYRITDMGMTHSFRNLYYEMLQRNVWAEGHGPAESGRHEEEHDVKVLENLRENLAFYGYSYGEVLRIIFCWGRVDNESKEMVRCLLAYYSLEMTKGFYHYYYDASPAVRQSERKRLINTLNGSFAGSWANKMMPYVVRNQAAYSVGARKDVRMEEVFHLNIELWNIPVRNGKIWPEDILDNHANCEEMKRLFRTVLTLAMFFEQKHYKAENTLSWRFKSSAVSDVESLLRGEDELLIPYSGLDIRSADRKANFNVFSFVTNAFSYISPKGGKQRRQMDEEESGREAEYNIRSLLSHLYDAIIQESGSSSQKEEILEMLGIDDEFDRWRAYSKGFVLPAYQVDLCYNLMKRVRQREQKAQMIRAEELLDVIRETFEFIREKLAQNDVYYRKNGIHLQRYSDKISCESMDISYEDAFNLCPFVYWILGERKVEGKTEKNDFLLDCFPQLFSNMVESMLLSDFSYEAPKADEQHEVSGYDD